jgi:hypothetical protein
MYIFERLVSYMSRQIHDRARPARNLANNLAKSIGLENFLQTLGAHITAQVNTFSDKTKKLFEVFGILSSDKQSATCEEGTYELPGSVCGVRKSWESFVESLGYAQSVDVSEVVTTYRTKVEDGSLEVVHLGLTGGLGYRIEIGNCLRACQRTETPIGSETFTRRRSGFRLRGCQNTVGKIKEFYLIEKELFALVDVWNYEQHRESQLNLVVVADAEQRLINVKHIGMVMVFAPWTGKTDEIDTARQCVLKVRQRDHF